MMPELKPCPFCGGRPLYTKTMNVEAVACLQCHAVVQSELGVDLGLENEPAEKLWNTRHDGGDSLREALEECQRVLASLIDVETIKATTVINAYAQVFAAECKARSAISNKIAPKGG